MENEREPQAGSAVGVGSTGSGDERFAARWNDLEPLVLASSSPRRAEILTAVGWPFETSVSNVDESMMAGEDPVSYVRRLAGEKAASVAATRLFGLVLGADTVVVAEGEVLGKPRDERDARRMLRLLSDCWHDVLTGVALIRAESGYAVTGYERTRVRFGAISDEEIDAYVSTGEPADKAGAYAVQGRAALFIEAIEGDYWNVVGLPVRLIYKLARQSSAPAN